MEPVTEEFVEQTADFIFHLSDKQLEDRIADLKKRQFNIHGSIYVEVRDYPEQNKKDYIWKLTLILIKCFESYEIKLPMISNASIFEIVNKSMDKSKHITPETDEGTSIQKAEDEIGQPHYFSYLKNLFENDENFHTLFEVKEAHNIYFYNLAEVYERD